MKKILAIVLTAVSLFTAVSCADDIKQDLNDLRARVVELEALVTSINDYYADISKIVSALEDHDMIRSITPLEGEAYLVTFVSGQTITLIQGIDGVSPNLGIKKYDDGLFYWTVQYGSEEPQWLLSNLGLKIRASALTPQMKIDDGWWQYSYDGGASWTRLCAATGEPGKSVFKNISVSDYFVTFTLASNSMFQIPTEQYFLRVVERCNAFSKELETATSILAGVDTTMAVKSITQIMEEGELVGYTLLLNNGKKLEIRSGKDEQPFIFTIKKDHSDWTDYWMVKVGDGAFTWVLDKNGNRAIASSMSGTPQLSAKDTLGGLYYAYSFYPDIDKYQLLRDSKGQLVPVSANDNLRLFKAIAVNADNVALTMADGTVAYLPFAYGTTPSIMFTPPEGITYDSSKYLYSEVEANKTYAVKYKITDATLNTQIDAIGMDGAVVKSVTKTGTGKILEGVITFTTPTTFPANATTTRVLVFMTWGSSVNMQVLEFKNKK